MSVEIVFDLVLELAQIFSRSFGRCKFGFVRLEIFFVVINQGRLVGSDVGSGVGSGIGSGVGNDVGSGISRWRKPFNIVS